MTDDDLRVECLDGCTSITRKGGYHNCNLSDAAEMGATASNLCRRLSPHPWLNARTAGWIAALVLLLVPSVMLQHHNQADESLALLRRSHMEYMILDLKGAQADAEKALDA